MTPSPRAWWLSFAGVCGAVLVPMVLLGLQNRSALEPVLLNGGLVESGPALIFLLASLGSAWIMVSRGLFLPWGLFGVFCFFLAGEEAEWGRDRVLGWESFRFTNESAPPGDLHNWFSSLIGDMVLQHYGELASPLVGTVLGGVAMLLALGVLGCLIGLGLFAPPTQLRGTSVGRIWRKDLSLQFAIAGTVLISFGFVDLLHSFGFPYMRGLWPLEESFELLGSIALLFAVLVKLVYPQSIASP